MIRSLDARRILLALVVVALFLAVVVGLPANAHATGGWTAQPSGTTTTELYSISFADSIHGLAVGDSGTILATTDGGAHWKAQASGTTLPLRSVAFPDPTHGWAVVGRGVVPFGGILATTDGGTTWATQASAPEVPLVAGFPATINSLAFTDATHGWAVGSKPDDPITAGASPIIFATTDGGATWTVQTSDAGHGLISVAFSDPTHGWAVGGKGTIVATTDGGATWTVQTSGTTEDLLSVSFSDATHGWTVGDNGTILSTTDGGATWTAQTSGTSQVLHSVSFSDATHGWTVGDKNTILFTTDGGATWTAQTSGTRQVLHSVAFPDAAHGWAVGDHGTILAMSGTPSIAAGGPMTVWLAAAVFVLLAAGGLGAALMVRRRTVSREPRAAPLSASGAQGQVREANQPTAATGSSAPVRYCTACGAPVGADAAYCESCGTRIGR